MTIPDPMNPKRKFQWFLNLDPWQRIAVLVLWLLLAACSCLFFSSCSVVKRLRANGSTDTGDWTLTLEPAPSEPQSILLPPLTDK